MHCIKTGLGALCAHPEPRSRAHCMRSTQVVGAAAHTTSWSSAQPAHVARLMGVHWSRHAQAACPPGCDLTSMSRHQGSQNHVATSNRCRDTTQNTPGRDLKTGSRHQTSCRQSTQVATSISCRDLALTRPGRDLKSCRDLKSFSLGHHMNFMSRPRTLQS